MHTHTHTYTHMHARTHMHTHTHTHTCTHSNMYWADWLENGAASIETASMDGRSRQVLVNSDINRPYGLTIDIASQTLYFIDGYYDNIERVNVDGSGRERLLHFRTDIVPYSLVYHNAALYWTERLDRVISMLTLQGETRVLSNVSLTNVRPAGLTLIAAERQPEGVCHALRLHLHVHVHCTCKVLCVEVSLALRNCVHV